MRTPYVLAATTLVASSLAAGLAPQLAAHAAPIPSTEVTWCDPVTPAPPCIASATINGSDVKSMSGWDISAQAFTIEGSNEISVSLLHDDGSGSDFELGADSLDDDVVVEILTGDMIPRLVTGKARDTAVARGGSGSAREVTVSGTPVVVSGQCDQSAWPWVCPEYTGTDPELDREWIGSFNFIVSDYGSWDDAAQRESFYGMNYFTNVAATSVPPEITEDPAGDPMLLIRLANRHFRSDGTTVVKGHGELRIPNAFLKEVYGIPNPATMTGASLTPSLSGGGPGSVVTTQEVGETAMLVTYDEVEFSARKLRVRTGVITPTRPTQVSATRTAPRRGFVDFDPSAPRGAKITGYEGRCVSENDAHGIASTSENIVRFSGLRKGVAYDCKVRALSKAGPSKWSETKRMGAKVVDVS